MKWLLPALLVACEQPPPTVPPAAPPTQVTFQPTVVAPTSAVAPPETAVTQRLERTPNPPKKVNDLWVFETPGQLLDAYLEGQDPGRLRVTGAVAAVVEVGGAAGTRFLLQGERRRFVELRFRDGGADALRKRVGQGSLITVQCTADARIGQNAQLVDCVLE